MSAVTLALAVVPATSVATGSEPAPEGAAAGPVTVSAASKRSDARLRPTNRQAHLAQVILATEVRTKPGGGRRLERLKTEATWGKGPVQLLILDAARDDQGERWLQVRLPSKPNDRAGWIRADHVRMGTTRWRIVIKLRRRTVEVRRTGRLVRRFRAVVGASRTPTPTGLFAVSEPIRQRSGNLGPWALHLTSHSDVLDNYGGGKGRVAIHGRSGAMLDDPLGSARSHGCIRIDNAAISWLAARAVAGTPVLIRR